MFQWMVLGSYYNDYPFAWNVAFDNANYFCLATKNHDSAQFVALAGQGITGCSIHASSNGTTFVLGIGY